MKQTAERDLFDTEFGETFVTSQKELADQVWIASHSDFPVLICGSTGTGKELIANAIHKFGSRSAKPMVAVNCGLIPREHVYSELFGVEKGAFSGVTKPRNGHFAEAKNATIFLDEIGEMPLDAQVGLLRVLETGRTKRLGEDDSGAIKRGPLNVRIIAATNRDIWNPDIFRQDLLHRLNVIPIQTPALQPSDKVIPVLLKRFLGARNVDRMDFHFFAFCCSAPWDGNARELRNFCDYAALQSRRGKVTLFPAVLHHFRAREACPEHVYSHFDANVPNFVEMQSIEEGIELPFWQRQLLPSELIPFLLTIFSIQSDRSEHLSSFSNRAKKWFSVRKVRRKKRSLRLLGSEPKLCNAFLFKDVTLEQLPDSALKTIGIDAADAVLIAMFMRARYEVEMHGPESDNGTEGGDSVNYHQALGQFEMQFFGRILQIYPNLSDSKIAQIVGLDKKTLREKRLKYFGE